MLNNALDIDISEKDFWEMTLAELDRLARSKRRVMVIEAKEKATHNYIHAMLVGKAIMANFDNKVKVPELHEIYPKLFTVDTSQQEEIQERKDELSALRFKHFAESFNKNFNGRQKG